MWEFFVTHFDRVCKLLEKTWALVRQILIATVGRYQVTPGLGVKSGEHALTLDSQR